MIGDPVAQWLLTILFFVTAVYAAAWILRANGIRDRIGYAIHLVMSAAMLIMVWPWGMNFALIPQAVVFSAATVWFLVQFLLPGTPRHDRETADGHHDARRSLLYHAAMMAAMVFMAVGMSTMRAGDGAGGSMNMGSMPGMDMSGSAGSGAAFPVWVAVLSLVCAIGFGIAALYFVGSLLAAATSAERSSRPARLRSANAGWNLLMAAGMAALFAPMITF